MRWLVFGQALTLDIVWERLCDVVNSKMVHVLFTCQENLHIGQLLSAANDVEANQSYRYNEAPHLLSLQRAKQCITHWAALEYQPASGRLKGN